MKNAFQVILLLTAMVLASCGTRRSDQSNIPPMTEASNVTRIPSHTPIATETFISYGCQPPGYPGTIHYANSDEFGDKFISLVPMASVEGKNYKEIVSILVTQWFEHYKTASASPSASIDDYKVEKISLLDPSCDPFFTIVASVNVLIIPFQVPHAMASSVMDEMGEWWRLYMPIGVFLDGDDYRLRLVFGWGT